MKLQKKAIIYFCMILITISVVFYFASNYFLTSTFGALEKRDVNQNVHRVINALDNEHTSLSATTGDYAGWDDMYNYVNQPNPNFVETNFSPTTFAKQRLNVVMIINQKNQLVFKKGYDFVRKKEVGIPLGLIAHFKPGSPLLVHSSVNSSRDGIVLVAEGPMVISVRPIITSQYQGPISGTLVMGRYLNAKEIARLEDLTAISFKLLDVNSPELPSAIKQDLIREPAKMLPSVPISDELINGYRLIKDIYGRPNIVVKVTQSREAYKLGMSFFHSLILIVNCLAFAAGLVVIFLLMRRMFLRLNSLTMSISEIKDTTDLKVRMPILGDDEISTLVTRINDMIESLEKSHIELVESEERYRGIVNDQTEFIARFDYDGKINFINDALTKAMGRTLQDFLGPVRTFDFIPKNEHKLIRDDFLRLSVDNPTSSIEFHIILPNGTLRWHQWTNRAIFNENGEFLEFQSVGRDITERKQAEEQIMLDEMRLEALVKLNQMTESTLKEITDYTQEEAVRLTGSKMGFLAFIDDEHARMTMHSWSHEATYECGVQDLEKCFDTDGLGLLGEPLRQKQPVIINDYSETSVGKKLPEGHMELNRVMLVPIMDGEHVVAVAGVGNKESDYDLADARQLTLLVSGMWRQIQRRRVEQALMESEKKLTVQVDYLNTLINNLNEVFMT
ncbi:MAG: CHASE4 domain-containing protein, partial [Candidatus Saccharibacteria bacterium]